MEQNLQIFNIRGGKLQHETYKNIKYKNVEKNSSNRWLRRMSNILSIRLQNILYCSKSVLRTKIICNDVKVLRAMPSMLLAF